VQGKPNRAKEFWRASMSDHGGMEMKAHEQTYGGFLTLLKFGTVACLAVAFLVVYLISH
jgi:hypothetical protein